MCRRHFANGEISRMFDRMSRDYPYSPSKVWQWRTGLEEPPEVRAEARSFGARISIRGRKFFSSDNGL